MKFEKILHWFWMLMSTILLILFLCVGESISLFVLIKTGFVMMVCFFFYMYHNICEAIEEKK